MATVTWNGLAGDNTWATATNWSSNAAPVSGDDVVLPAGFSAIFLATTQPSGGGALNSLTLGDGSGPATLQLLSGVLSANTVLFANSSSLIDGAGAINALSISGAGTIAAGSAASGGVLDLFGAIGGGVSLAINSGAATTLKIEGVGSVSGPIAFDFSNLQTLEIGAAGALTIAGTQDFFSGTLKLDGGSLSATTIAVGSNAKIVGAGLVSGPVGGTGLITATGGVLRFADALSGSLLMQVGSGATLELDGASSAAGQLVFLGSLGALEIGASGSLTLTDALIVGPNTVKLDGSGVQLTDAAGLVMANSAITGTGTISSSTAISGYGTVGIALSGGTVTASGGTLEFTGAVDASGATTFAIDSSVAGSALKFDQAVGLGATQPTVTFTGGSGDLNLAGESAYTNFDGKVAGFQSGDTIEIAATSAGDTVQLNADGHTLEVYDSTHTLIDSITLVGNYAGAAFQLVDAGGVDTITTNAICFMAGARIRTPDGEAPIETLRRGDRVLTVDGGVAPIKWLGRQTIATAFADPQRVWPIRIKAGALGEGAPRRDLLLSPDHALFVDGALIQAGALVNGVSILRETQVPRSFVYYHIELEGHDLILAEGVPAETFVDNVDRLGFDNWAEHEALYPQGGTVDELPYPRAKAHRQVPPALRARLVARARLIGMATADVA